MSHTRYILPVVTRNEDGGAEPEYPFGADELDQLLWIAARTAYDTGIHIEVHTDYEGMKRIVVGDVSVSNSIRDQILLLQGVDLAVEALNRAAS